MSPSSSIRWELVLVSFSLISSFSRRRAPARRRRFGAQGVAELREVADALARRLDLGRHLPEFVLQQGQSVGKISRASPPASSAWAGLRRRRPRGQGGDALLHARGVPHDFLQQGQHPPGALLVLGAVQQFRQVALLDRPSNASPGRVRE
ncbi:MAG: hypothetical protein U1F87_08460 [Kiritimatiellia bacterium]